MIQPERPLHMTLAFTSFNENRTLDVPPIEFSKTLNVFNASIQCSSVEASVNIDVGVEVNAQISLSVVVSGSVVPPELDEFGIVTGEHYSLSTVIPGLIGSTGVDADLLGSLDITANALVCFVADHPSRLTDLHAGHF